MPPAERIPPDRRRPGRSTTDSGAHERIPLNRRRGARNDHRGGKGVKLTLAYVHPAGIKDDSRRAIRNNRVLNRPRAPRFELDGIPVPGRRRGLARGDKDGSTGGSTQFQPAVNVKGGVPGHSISVTFAHGQHPRGPHRHRSRHDVRATAGVPSRRVRDGSTGNRRTAAGGHVEVERRGVGIAFPVRHGQDDRLHPRRLEGVLRVFSLRGLAIAEIHEYDAIPVRRPLEGDPSNVIIIPGVTHCDSEAVNLACTGLST